MAAVGTVTYTADLTKPLDRVRFEVGDVDCANAYLSDEEIEAVLLNENGDVLRAASRAALGIAARVARQMDYSHGPVRKSASQLYDHFTDLAATLESRANTDSVKPYLGPTPAEQQAADQDPSRVQPEFGLGMDDNPRAGPQINDNPDDVR